MEIIQTDAGTQFTSKEFQGGISVRKVRLELAAPYHQEINFQVEVTCQTLQTISHSIVVHARVSDEYVHFDLMYTTDIIFPVIQIKHLVNQDCEPTKPHKLETGNKPSVANPMCFILSML